MAAGDLAVGAIPVMVIVQGAVADHGRNEGVLMLWEGEGGGSALPAHLWLALWGRGTHIVRAVVVAVCVKEDAKPSKVVPRTKHRPWQWQTEAISTHTPRARAHTAHTHTFHALVLGVPECKPVPEEKVSRSMHCKVHDKLPIVETNRLYRWGSRDVQTVPAAQLYLWTLDPCTDHSVPYAAPRALAVRCEPNVVRGDHRHPAHVPVLACRARGAKESSTLRLPSVKCAGCGRQHQRRAW